MSNVRVTIKTGEGVLGTILTLHDELGGRGQFTESGGDLTHVHNGCVLNDEFSHLLLTDNLELLVAGGDGLALVEPLYVHVLLRHGQLEDAIVALGRRHVRERLNELTLTF